MSITISIDDIKVTVSSLSEAAALIRELRDGKTSVAAAEPAPKLPEERRQPAANGSVKAVDLEVANNAVKFLKVIRDNPNGVQADAIMTALGVDKPKAIGSRSGPINKLLLDVGFKPKAVYKNPRTPSGRVWQPCKQMQNAISTIEQRLGAH